MAPQKSIALLFVKMVMRVCELSPYVGIGYGVRIQLHNRSFDLNEKLNSYYG